MQYQSYGAQSGSYANVAGAKQVLSSGLIRKRRLNIVAAAMSLFLPWLMFCAVASFVSFSMHYYNPGVMYVILGSVGLPLALLTGMKFYYSTKSLLSTNIEQDGFLSANWVLFALLTSLIAFVAAYVFGESNFTTNLQPYYDLLSLESYTNVNPATMQGQEIMDASMVNFANGTTLDLTKAIGFKNMDVYCVAPITMGTTTLATYDFFAVGKGCCSESKANFQCGAYNDPKAHQGVRVLDDSDRAFYRLAVQQAESAYAIKAVHPLFFTWTSDAEEDHKDMMRAGYQKLLLGVMGFFAFQMFLVFVAMSCFSTLGQRD
jgi:hypothetical protein